MENILRCIGAGACGSVWAAPFGSRSDDTEAIKREDGNKYRSLRNDYLMHLKAIDALSISQSRILIPVCHQYISRMDITWWNDIISRFPKDCQEYCNVLVTERIPPFRRWVREALVDIYCPEAMRPSIKASEASQDCMIRPYLGRRRRFFSRSLFKGFSLRNFILHIDQIEQIPLNGRLYAEIMAETLACLYWRAHVDADDVEFVLAPLRDVQTSSLIAQIEDYPVRQSTTINSLILGEHAVWMLDFDCCKDMSLDQAGVEQAVAAFYRNDPYFPRPGKSLHLNDQRLWGVFKNRFLRASEAILDQGSPEAQLPAFWVKLVEDWKA